MGKQKNKAWRELDPTPSQIRCITRFCIILKIQYPWEDLVSNRGEAADVQFFLLKKLKKKGGKDRERGFQASHR
jgi:hypothetical protein